MLEGGATPPRLLPGSPLHAKEHRSLRFRLSSKTPGHGCATEPDQRQLSLIESGEQTQPPGAAGAVLAAEEAMISPDSLLILQTFI